MIGILLYRIQVSMKVYMNLKCQKFILIKLYCVKTKCQDRLIKIFLENSNYLLLIMAEEAEKEEAAREELGAEKIEEELKRPGHMPFMLSEMTGE